MTFPGKFITFEGCNGVGKSTHVRILSEKLQSMGVKVVVTREPGGTPIAEKIRHLLREEQQQHKMTELLLMFAARNEHFVNLIVPHLSNGAIVLCDRFYDSSLIFQGVLNGIDIEHIMQLKQMTIGNFEPDLTILLESSFQSVSRNISDRVASEDKYDTLAREKFEVLQKAYKKMSQVFSDRYVVVKSNAPVDKVSEKVFSAVSSIL